MASFVEVEKLALALSEHERATLAAKLIASLPDSNSDHDAESGSVRFKNVNSSMLRRVRYDPQNRFLDVVFRTGEKYRNEIQNAPLIETLSKVSTALLTSIVQESAPPAGNGHATVL